MNKDQILKPCPFCGGKARVCYYVVRNEKYRRYYVQCSYCESSGEAHKEEKDAIAAWNTRHEERGETVLKQQKNILDTILTDSQKLAMHFLELLPEGKKWPNDRDNFEQTSEVRKLKASVTFMIWTSENLVARIKCQNFPRGWLAANSTKDTPFSLDSTTIPQEILDLIPDKENNND